MQSLRADVHACSAVSPLAPTTATKRGGYSIPIRQIRLVGVLVRRGRYYLYRIAGTVVSVAGSWAG